MKALDIFDEAECDAQPYCGDFDDTMRWSKPTADIALGICERSQEGTKTTTELCEAW